MIRTLWPCWWSTLWNAPIIDIQCIGQWYVVVVMWIQRFIGFEIISPVSVQSSTFQCSQSQVPVGWVELYSHFLQHSHEVVGRVQLSSLTMNYNYCMYFILSSLHPYFVVSVFSLEFLGNIGLLYCNYKLSRPTDKHCFQVEMKENRSIKTEMNRKCQTVLWYLGCESDVHIWWSVRAI